MYSICIGFKMQDTIFSHREYNFSAVQSPDSGRYISASPCTILWHIHNQIRDWSWWLEMLRNDRFSHFLQVGICQCRNCRAQNLGIRSQANRSKCMGPDVVSTYKVMAAKTGFQVAYCDFRFLHAGA